MSACIRQVFQVLGLLSAARLDGEVGNHLRSLVDLAPLRQPAALEGVDLLKRLLQDQGFLDDSAASPLPPGFQQLTSFAADRVLPTA